MTFEEYWKSTGLDVGFEDCARSAARDAWEAAWKAGYEQGAEDGLLVSYMAGQKEE